MNRNGIEDLDFGGESNVLLGWIKIGSWWGGVNFNWWGLNKKVCLLAWVWVGEDF
jgi:hypothetical protein